MVCAFEGKSNCKGETLDKKYAKFRVASESACIRDIKNIYLSRRDYSIILSSDG